MGRPLIDIAGQRFGRLTVTKVTARRSNKREAYWLCACDCGRVVEERVSDLRSGRVHSCGCYAADLSRDRRVHGHLVEYRRSPTWISWQSMLARCNLATSHAYDRYGGRGIQVCERWRHDFSAFLADMGERQQGTTLDRFPDGKGNYEPGNCRWGTYREQALNRSCTQFLTLGEKTQALSDWSREMGISHSTLSSRLRNGWSPERALTTPVRVNRAKEAA